MINPGIINELSIKRKAVTGIYLADAADNEVLLPNRYVNENHSIGDKLEVFVYFDSEDRLVATTETPKIFLNEFAFLEVKEITKIGAFLDWGLSKDLLVPFSEQLKKMTAGEKYVVYLYLDQKTNRLVGTTRLTNYLQQVFISLSEGDEVDLLIFEETDLGFKAIVNEDHEGLIYKNEVFQPLKVGEKVKGYVKMIRDDKKIDLILQRNDVNDIGFVAANIIQKLNENGGFLAVSDKSDPKAIQELFHVSKKMFKKAIGNLYRKRQISIDENGIRIT